eukprot:16452390-Heterocapsa_arctica.AAC.2
MSLYSGLAASRKCFLAVPFEASMTVLSRLTSMPHDSSHQQVRMHVFAKMYAAAFFPALKSLQSSTYVRRWAGMPLSCAASSPGALGSIRIPLGSGALFDQGLPHFIRLGVGFGAVGFAASFPMQAVRLRRGLSSVGLGCIPRGRAGLRGPTTFFPENIRIHLLRGSFAQATARARRVFFRNRFQVIPRGGAERLMPIMPLWFPSVLKSLGSIHSRFEVDVQQPVSQRAARRDPMVRMDRSSHGSGPPDTSIPPVLVYCQSYKPADLAVFGSLGEESGDGDVVVAFFAINESPEGHQSPGRSDFGFHSANPSCRVRAPAGPHSPSRHVPIVG